MIAERPNAMITFEKSNFKIDSATPGWTLDAWKYTPKDTASKAHPVIVMAHGFSANKLMGLQSYAETFSASGYACVVFDYMRWGASDGTPRHIFDVKEQLEDYRTVIKHVRQHPEFDHQRVILFGSSFSGGHVITLCAEPDLDIFATIAQCPYTGISPSPSLSFALIRKLSYAVIDALKRRIGLNPLYIPAVAERGQLGALAVDGAKHGLQRLAPIASDYPNEVNASCLFEIPFYKPISTASQIKTPIIIIAPEEDNMCSFQGAKEFVRIVKDGNAELRAVPGAHFEVYPGCEQHELSLNSQLAFLRNHVPL